jgi:hypothetical protein
MPERIAAGACASGTGAMYVMTCDKWVMTAETAGIW